MRHIHQVQTIGKLLHQTLMRRFAAVTTMSSQGTESRPDIPQGIANAIKSRTSASRRIF
jgi:hypothetical protein